MKKYKFNVNGNNYAVHIKNVEGQAIELEVNGTPYTVEMEREVKSSKTPKLVRSSAPRTAAPKAITRSAKKTNVVAPLPGTIVSLKVAAGDKVTAGDLLMTMEAMKMENNVLAEADGVVGTVKVSEGQSVLQGEVLVEME
ncbi:biotin/lipoyl-binding protein [Flammeovirga yaeyamensis]|uniref:Biotin/lipoyl-binding protein n=1 Tax=Flammeovirga yaeyamensis TaxID=367791 RepID=A0AAX1N2A9_9BACT|nr:MULTISPECIES: biotin/lipoyl-containing protein [Flammeovirga]ANQ48315.1 biotin/lipoyl-binding protein [Flammeovirga sp. MY04]MBB3696217.1 biotin carboxyl carrier protein [Flammeovirga yaeyamensis]NMF34898.1 biotin/lipoyl-binding protein [Flammeovirga yaeyamensis]QWG00275.1 biotin/lipoyl-binding protein [Flammeovirga yaeyamensis]